MSVQYIFSIAGFFAVAHIYIYKYILILSICIYTCPRVLQADISLHPFKIFIVSLWLLPDVFLNVVFLLPRFVAEVSPHPTCRQHVPVPGFTALYRALVRCQAQKTLRRAQAVHRQELLAVARWRNGAGHGSFWREDQSLLKERCWRKLRLFKDKKHIIRHIMENIETWIDGIFWRIWRNKYRPWKRTKEINKGRPTSANPPEPFRPLLESNTLRLDIPKQPSAWIAPRRQHTHRKKRHRSDYMILILYGCICK